MTKLFSTLTVGFRGTVSGMLVTRGVLTGSLDDTTTFLMDRPERVVITFASWTGGARENRLNMS